ncbi:MAG: hypothetical protein Q9168_008328, partial [Polycauliona sp. 1 TL-2023]
ILDIDDRVGVRGGEKEIGDCAGEPVAFFGGVGAAPGVLDGEGQGGPGAEGEGDGEVEGLVDLFCGG